jgi:hypothetical protein
MPVWHGARTVHSISNFFRHAAHHTVRAVSGAVRAAVEAAPHVNRALEDARGVYGKLKPLLHERGYGAHLGRVDHHLSTYDRLRKALAE